MPICVWNPYTRSTYNMLTASWIHEGIGLANVCDICICIYEICSSEPQNSSIDQSYDSPQGEQKHVDFPVFIRPSQLPVWSWTLLWCCTCAARLEYGALKFCGATINQYLKQRQCIKIRRITWNRVSRDFIAFVPIMFTYVNTIPLKLCVITLIRYYPIQQWYDLT